MNDRIEAAAKTLAKAEGFDDVMQYERDVTVATLAAADAVMFSDEAVDRAARAIALSDGWEESMWPQDVFRKSLRSYYQHARAVIAVLKGDDA